MSALKHVDIYTDGACLGNPGPGGYGAIIDFKGRQKEISGGFRLTTNNRMELLAAIRALELLKEPCEVSVYSDSQYLVQAMTAGWVSSWQKRGWKKADKAPVLNVDLWQMLVRTCETHAVSFFWVRGHSGHPENERCDRLAVSAASGGVLLTDTAYEESKGVGASAP